MLLQYTDTQMGAIFAVSDDLKNQQSYLKVQNNLLKIIWNRNPEPICLEIDTMPVELKSHQMISATFLHHVIFDKKETKPLTSFIFNKEFYCLQQHDAEVSCNGILFFGAMPNPIISIPESEIHRFEMLYQIFTEEFKNQDKVQGEMLQLLLKRLIIKCTRLAKAQLNLERFNDSQIDIVRKFNLLVDFYYKDKKQVADYAELLNKSPKTLSNLFNAFGIKTPQQIIHERVALEAKRLLTYTNKSCKEIAFELGFEDPAHFSKFFKKVQNQTPLAYKSTFITA